jgi:hypothetical protein
MNEPQKNREFQQLSNKKCISSVTLGNSFHMKKQVKRSIFLAPLKTFDLPSDLNIKLQQLHCGFNCFINYTMCSAQNIISIVPLGDGN